MTVDIPAALRHGRNRITRDLLGESSSVLDFGCGDGSFAAAIAQHMGVPVYACDVNPKAVAMAEERPGVHPFLVSDIDPSIPLQSGQLAAVTCCDVLEHMDEGVRRTALAEISRVLADDGALIVTTPHKGLFSFADPENFKFYAPRLHRIVFRALKGRELYERKYGGERFGNYSGRAQRHRHFSVKELREILRDAGFEIEAVRYYTLVYPFARIALWTAQGLLRKTAVAKPLVALCWRLYVWDADLEVGPAACSVGLRARKIRRA